MSNLTWDCAGSVLVFAPGCSHSPAGENVRFDLMIFDDPLLLLKGTQSQKSNFDTAFHLPYLNGGGGVIGLNA